MRFTRPGADHTPAGAWPCRRVNSLAARAETPPRVAAPVMSFAPSGRGRSLGPGEYRVQDRRLHVCGVVLAADLDRVAVALGRAHVHGLARHDTDVLELGHQVRVELDVFGDAADLDLAAATPGDLVDAHQVALDRRCGLALAELVQAGDRVAVRGRGGVAEQLDELALHGLAHHVLPAAGLAVDVLPLQADHVDQEAPGEPGLAHHRDGERAGAGGGPWG